MAKRIAISSLNASTVDILNTIRANASYEYQSMVPEISDVRDIPRVGEVLYGYPALANQFLNSLVNRIALVRVKSAVFNNAYAELKKGYLEFGETVEEVFVNIAKAREFSAEKADAREHKRSLPDVRTAFHTMNWRVQYPVTIQDSDLRMAFNSAEGVTDLIAKIVDSVYTAAEYDEYLLFKYLMIKAVTKGKMFPVQILPGANTNPGVAFRGTSNKITFMSNKYNAAGVTTSTPKSDQYIFMSSDYNAQYDVTVLASAFNMDKADFMGKLKLVDDWTTFDNDRFSEIASESDAIEPVTDAELALMAKVKAILVDREWFQVYDNQNKFTEKYVASGMYWNYFYNVWKTVSSSPFSNAIVFVDDSVEQVVDSFNVTISDKNVTKDGATVLTLSVDDADSISRQSVEFVQDGDCTENGVAVHKYGVIIIPAGYTTSFELFAKIGDYNFNPDVAISSSSAVGETIAYDKV